MIWRRNRGKKRDVHHLWWCRDESSRRCRSGSTQFRAHTPVQAKAHPHRRIYGKGGGVHRPDSHPHPSPPAQVGFRERRRVRRNQLPTGATPPSERPMGGGPLRPGPRLACELGGQPRVSRPSILPWCASPLSSPSEICQDDDGQTKTSVPEQGHAVRWPFWPLC